MSGLEGVPMRELIDELVKRLGLAEVCRQLGVTEDELQQLRSMP